jgi:uncharacterized membrane protein YbjE (DUF340 family)
MDALIQIAILVAFLLAGALLHMVKLAPKPVVVDFLLKLTLWALLFVMGFRLGNSSELFERMGEIGAMATATAILALAGTVAAIRLAYATLDFARGRRGVGRAAAAAESSAAATHGAPAHVRPGIDWAHFKAPAILLAVVVVGVIAGVASPELRGFDYGAVTGWVLNALLFMVGMQFAQSGLSLKAAFARVDTILVPAATAVGSLAGGAIVAAIFSIGIGKGMALAAGFGWYSLSGVLIADLGDPALGSAAFLANMLREALALVLIPILAASKRPYTAIGAGGATAMDVTLPLIEQCVGPAAVPVSFTSGALLSLLVPFLVPLVYSL